MFFSAPAGRPGSGRSMKNGTEDEDGEEEEEDGEEDDDYDGGGVYFLTEKNSTL